MDVSSILFAALGIGFLIFVHELGHFLAARLAGVRVEVFSLGFGPRLLGFVWRGTDFRLSAVPFGGFVMVAGQDPNDHRWPARECLHSKSVGQRALFWSGGVLMNLLFAFIAFPLVFAAGVDFTAPVAGRVAEGSAAWEAGIAPGDRIVALGGAPVHAFEHLVVEAALTGGRRTAVRVRGPDGAERDVVVVPQWDAADGLYGLGIASSTAGPPLLRIAAGSPAADAGLRDGDQLLAVDGRALTEPLQPEALAALAGGEPFVLTVRTAAGERVVRVVPRPAERTGELLIGVRPLPRQVAGIRHGALFVERLGLRRGDVLLAVDDAPFTSGDLAVAASGPEVLRLHVRRDGREVLLAEPAGAAERAELIAAVALRGDDSLLLLPEPGQPAALAGLSPGERIAAVDGVPMRRFEDLRAAVRSSGGRPMRLLVHAVDPQRREGAGGFLDPSTGELALAREREITLAARERLAFDSGIAIEQRTLTTTVRAASFGEALVLGAGLSVGMLKQLYVTLKRMVTGDVGAKNLGGIIRISQVSYQAAQRGPSWFFYLLAMLSLNLAFVNLLPIPVLDGGHLLFLLIERIKGSPVSARVFGYSQVLGLVFVLMLVLFVTYNDILQLL
jgi:regulator of sigma E protease